MVVSDLPTKAKLMHTFLARLPVTSNLQIVVSGGDQEAVNGVGSRCVKAKPSASQGNWRTRSAASRQGGNVDTQLSWPRQLSAKLWRCLQLILCPLKTGMFPRCNRPAWIIAVVCAESLTRRWYPVHGHLASAHNTHCANPLLCQPCYLAPCTANMACQLAKLHHAQPMHCPSGAQHSQCGQGSAAASSQQVAHTPVGGQRRRTIRATAGVCSGPSCTSQHCLHSTACTSERQRRYSFFAAALEQ